LDFPCEDDARAYRLTHFVDKYAIFEPQKAQFVRLQATSASSATQFVRIVDIGVWAIDSFTPPVRGLGKWGPTIDFPLVPVGVFIDPISGKVISFSSFAHDAFSQSDTDGTTLTSAWDRATGTVSQRRVRHTGHDMFCPGMAFDVNGRMLISGGESAEKVSIYEPTSDDWKTVPPMNIARGYAGSTTCADGRIFIIGGSWGPEGQPRGNRTGEIYDPKTNAWSLLDGCPASPIETTEDWETNYRADNHVWLMGWSNNSVFHAGPAKDMHWITTAGKGAIENAGRREDHDAMCGVAAMYDAGKGKILATGGARQYKLKENGEVMGTNATNHASIITLGQVNATVNVEPAGQDMNYQRIFHHAVILPNGETFVVGGQIEGTGFTEDSPQLVPEIYSPTRNIWTPMAAHSTVRVYHSFGLLLPDATVIVGGGGLCGNCDGQRVNHFDAQIYTPQYLLTSNGDRAKRPVIARTSAASVKPGASLTIVTYSDVVGASLVRYGGATHSLNNDQRRIELKLQKSGPPLQYSVSIPSDGGIAIPGYWMLFVLNAQGVPSEAKNVQILVS
jgi:galactose oxidase